MGASAAIVGGLVAGSVIASNSAPGMPNFEIPAAPTPQASSRSASAATDRSRQRPSGGRSSTLLTGPGGLIGSAPGIKPTLLGS